MAAKNFLTSLLKDPPPAFLFELSEAGIAVARTTSPPQIGFRAIEPQVIAVSPVEDNVLKPDVLAGHVRALAPARDGHKRQRAVLILPDCGIRVSVLDFDAFPAKPEEQLSLVRFRIKKSMPFDLEGAKVGFYPQANGHGKQRDVVIVVAPIETVARYEAPFRAAGFHPGMVTTSTLAALQMVRGSGLSVLTKLTGRILTISVVENGIVKLIRCIEVTEITPQEMLSHLHPTFSYAEDQLGAKPEKLLMCGFGQESQKFREEFQTELGVDIEPLRSRFGVPDQNNAGLMGYLEAMEEA